MFLGLMSTMRIGDGFIGLFSFFMIHGCKVNVFTLYSFVVNGLSRLYIRVK